MFKTRAEAIEALAASCFADELEALMGALVPTLTFSPIQDARPGGTRLGGDPDLPAGASWPIRPAYPDNHPIFEAGGPTHATHLDRYGARDFPFVFIGQVDLVEARRVGGELTEGLPAEGRLLFFYDAHVGPWTGLFADAPRRAAHVIWDRTPATDLQPLPTHPLLVSDERASEEETLKHERMTPEEKFELNRELYEMAGLKPSDLAPPDEPRSREEILEFNSRNRSPDQPMALQKMLTLPAREAVEARLSGPIQKVLADSELEECYIEMFGWGGDAFSGPQGAARLHRMLGPTVPVQDDPRLDAQAFLADLEAWKDKAFMRRQEERALQRQMLLQVDLSALMQRNVEGVIYFLIDADDLAKRDFSRTVVDYQQT